MNDYVIAIYNAMEGDNRLFLIKHAESVEAALKRALKEHCDPEYYDERYQQWIDDMPNDVNAIRDAAFQSDLSISNILMLMVNV